MADTRDNSRREIEQGRQHIADIRSAIADKLTVLENRVEETVDAVKHTVDLRYQVNARPWFMLGGALLVGYTLGRRGGRSVTVADTSREPSASSQPSPSLLNAVTGQVKDELATLKGPALVAVVSTLWAMAKQVLLPGAGRQQTTSRDAPTVAKSASRETFINGVARTAPRGPQ